VAPIVHRFPCLQDNYGFLLHDPDSGETACIDTPDAERILAEAKAKNWTITQIWNTHWHPDHAGGNAAIKAATGAVVSGPAAEAERIPTLDIALSEGDTLRLGDHVAQVIETPGHTAGHIVFHLPDDEVAFTGDTLFAMGCGRLFEGNAAQMFDNMAKLAALPDATTIYCAHEYTQANGRFARVAEPDNQAVIERMKLVDAARKQGEATLPTTIAEERATNPFLRADSAEHLAKRRAAKDAFRG